jgi:hypothetical protein
MTRVADSLAQAEQDLEEAELRLQELGKLTRGVVTAKLQMMQQLKQFEASQHRGGAETVKAFMHPTLGRVCTAHDCVVLKIFAIMDVVYGIGTALQQVKFTELKQGKGVGVSADEGVREFAARVRMHMQSSLDLDPKLAHIQFFAGLADSAVAATAKAFMQSNKSIAMNLETATEQVLLIEARELEDLKLRAANGDAQASAELKRRAALGSRKPPKETPKAAADTSKAAKPVRTYHHDPNHPEAQCKLPGHDKGRGHMNKDCHKGGSANTSYAMSAVAAAPSSVASYHAAAAVPSSSSAASVDPAVAAWQQAAMASAAQTQQVVNMLREQMAHAAMRWPPNSAGGASKHPSSNGTKCTICGFPNGHPGGFCYYEYPEKNPTWVPTTNARPELIAHWTQRRQQRNLPPLAPRPVPPRQPYVANVVCLPAQVPALPPAAPVLMLPPPQPEVTALQYDPATEVVTLTSLAKLTFGDAAPTQPHLAGAAMPRSFLQLAPPTTAVASAEVTSSAQASGSNASQAAAAATQVRGILKKEKSVGRKRVRISATGSAAPVGQSDASPVAPVGQRVQRVDEFDQLPTAQAPTRAQVESMLAALDAPEQAVACLDTFVNLTAATGVSMQLPDDRWQLPNMVITDSGVHQQWQY